MLFEGFDHKLTRALPWTRKETSVSLTFPLTFGVCHHSFGDIHRRCEEGPGESFPYALTLECLFDIFMVLGW